MDPETLHARFLELLPRIERHAKIYFSGIACSHQRAEKIAETIALAWQWFRRLSERGKDVMRFPMAFTFLVARAVRCGRRLTGMEKTKDVMSPLAQQRYGFLVETLPSSTCRSCEIIYSRVTGQRDVDAFEERLRDNTFTPPPDQAAFRIDFALFLHSLTARDRKMARYLSLGNTNKAAADQFALTPGRVTQLRQQWHREWCVGQGEVEPARLREPNPAAPASPRSRVSAEV